MQGVVFMVLILLLFHGASCKSPHEAILGKEKVTHLHFFFHDVQSGDDPTAIVIARPRGNSASPTFFGTSYVFDDRLTEGPEPNSTLVGNAQGIYVSTEKEKVSAVFNADFEFTAGEFNGSSICVFSRNPVSETHRELAVVGGRGKFRFARGVAKLTTLFLNITSGNDIAEYHVKMLTS